MDSSSDGPVVVGVDGSDNARRALLAAVHQAAASGVPVVAVHAIGMTEMVDGEHVPTHDHRAEIVERVEQWCDGVDGDDERVDVRVVDGAPVEVLLRTARDTGASMIVVGRSGAGARPELLLGSTAHQIAEHGPCPVLVIPPA